MAATQSEIALAPASPADLEKWDSIVADAPRGTPFHRLGWLRAMAAESRTELVPLVARSSQEPVAVFPVFLKRRVKMLAVFSPPPACAVGSLGPVFCTTRSRQRGREVLHSAVAEAFARFLAEERVDYASVSLHHALSDVRPYVWQAFSAHPAFDYVVSVEASEEDLFASFESDVRTCIRRAREIASLRIVDGGIDEALRLLEMLRERYAQQGKAWTVSPGYLRALFDSVPPGQIGVKLATLEDRILTGMVTLYYGDLAQDWIGGFAPVEQVRGANELLHWTIIQEARARGARFYDLGGANTPHLARNKVKYNPELRPYYRVEKASLFGRTIREVAASPLGRSLYARLR